MGPGVSWMGAGDAIDQGGRRYSYGQSQTWPPFIVFTSDTYGHLLKGMQWTAAEALDHLLA